jgi:hypothetical protein
MFVTRRGSMDQGVIEFMMNLSPIIAAILLGPFFSITKFDATFLTAEVALLTVMAS